MTAVDKALVDFRPRGRGTTGGGGRTRSAVTHRGDSALVLADTDKEPMDEKRHCPECNYHLDDYAEDEILCGACFNLENDNQSEYL